MTVTHTPPQIKVGDVATVSQPINENDVQIFADVIQDHAPVYLDPKYASNTIYGKRIVHVGLVASFIPKALMGLTGTTLVYKSQSIQFIRPAHIGDILTIKAEVMDMVPTVLNKNYMPVFASAVVVKVGCTNQKDQTIFDGKVEIVV